MPRRHWLNQVTLPGIVLFTPPNVIIHHYCKKCQLTLQAGHQVVADSGTEREDRFAHIHEAALI